MPSSTYSWMRAATFSPEPTSASPTPSRARPMPVQRFGPTQSPPRLIAQHALALLALAVGLALVVLHLAFEVVGNVRDQRLGGRDRFLVGLARDHEQADAEPQRPAELRRALAHVGDPLAHHRDRLAPEQVHVRFFRADALALVRRAAEVPRRARLLVRLREDVALLDFVVLAFVAPRLRLRSRPCSRPA